MHAKMDSSDHHSTCKAREGAGCFLQATDVTWHSHGVLLLTCDHNISFLCKTHVEVDTAGLCAVTSRPVTQHW
jgi:hypothetical protein